MHQMGGLEIELLTLYLHNFASADDVEKPADLQNLHQGTAETAKALRAFFFLLFFSPCDTFSKPTTT